MNSKIAIVMGGIAVATAAFIAIQTVTSDPVSECVTDLIKHGTQEAFEQNGNDVIANYTNGGAIFRYRTAGNCMIKNGERLVLAGQAISAGTLMADQMHKAGKFCMGPRAKFFFHEGTWGDVPYPVDHLYSTEIQEIVARNGGWPSTKSRNYTELTAVQLSGIYPWCKR